MSITSTEIIEDSPQVDGTRHIGFKFTFHTGEEVIRRFLAPVDYDENAGILALKPEIETYIIEQEDDELVGLIMKGGLSASKVIPVHPETDSDDVRKKRLQRKILRRAMEEEDIKVARRLFHTIWNKEKNIDRKSDKEMMDYFDIKSEDLNIVNSRFQNIHDNLAKQDLDSTYVKEIE